MLISLILLLALGAPANGEGLEALAFWRSKPSLTERLREERAIIVSVKAGKASKPGLERFTMSGVGWVHRDAKTIFKLANEFERLKEVSENFREVKWEKKTNRVFLVCEALGYQARMLLKVEPDEAAQSIRFQVVDGHFLGLTGVLDLRPTATSGYTEVSFRAEHEAKDLPVPKFLMGFALEVVTQRVAGKMRQHFETASSRATSPF